MNVYVYLPKYLTQLNKTLIYLSQNKKNNHEMRTKLRICTNFVRTNSSNT